MKRAAWSVRQAKAKGFSLIELLVVIGIIVLMIGGLGLALRGGGGNIALQSGQGTLASLVAATRSHAALSQSRTMLVIDADPAADSFLRAIRVAVEVPGSPNVWEFVSDASYLPTGAYVVPATAISGVTLAPATGGAWPTARVSSTTTTPTRLALKDGTQSALSITTSFTFTTAGTLGSAGGDKFVLATARRTSPTALVFDNPAAIRGIILSAYGAPILVNDAAGFDN